MRRVPILVAISLAACTSAPGMDEGVALEIVSPAAGEMFVRDDLDAQGARIAAVPIEVTIDGEVAKVSLSLAQTAIGDLDAEGHATAELRASGTATLVATALDADGAELATASVEVQVIEPTIASCRAWLDLYRVQYTVGPNSPGVTDPVTATMPINGMPYRSGGAARTKMFGDCSLIKSLAEAAPMWKTRGVVEVTDLGVYNYRCIGNTGTPPNCPNGISQHAYGNAIDLASFKDAQGMTFSVLNDFVIDPAPEKTCTAATEPGKDQWLHEMICALKAAKTWNIVLTPNYNADHRDHFHVDLKAGSDFID